VLGSSVAELGSSAHELERTRPRIDHTPAITGTTTKLERSTLECTSLGSSALGHAQCDRRLLTA
jgi:hypothetical protein